MRYAAFHLNLIWDLRSDSSIKYRFLLRFRAMCATTKTAKSMSVRLFGNFVAIIAILRCSLYYMGGLECLCWKWFLRSMDYCDYDTFTANTSNTFPSSFAPLRSLLFARFSANSRQLPIMSLTTWYSYAQAYVRISYVCYGCTEHFPVYILHCRRRSCVSL